MSQNTLCSVRELLMKNTNLNKVRCDKLLEHMQMWDINLIIYPSRIKSLLRISFNETYEILDILKDAEILTYNYQIYCSKCKRFIDRPVLLSLNQFPEEIYCDEGHELNPIRDVVLVYRVIERVQ